MAVESVWLSEGELLCRLADLEARGAVEVERDDPPFSVVVALFAGNVRAYVNRCPHRGTPLNMFPDKFLCETGEEIICATHGARFQVKDGHCTFGPCRGAFLEAVPVVLRGHLVFSGLNA